MDFLLELTFIIIILALSKLLDFVVFQDSLIELDHIIINFGRGYLLADLDSTLGLFGNRDLPLLPKSLILILVRAKELLHFVEFLFEHTVFLAQKVPGDELFFSYYLLIFKEDVDQSYECDEEVASYVV